MRCEPYLPSKIVVVGLANQIFPTRNSRQSLQRQRVDDPFHLDFSPSLGGRFGAEIIHRRQRVDGVVIWDMACGTIGRPCPKLAANASRATQISANRSVPPPCLYLFPRSIPDARNNPTPACWRLNEIQLLHSLWRAFHGDDADIVDVRIEARIEGVDVQRRTRFFCAGEEMTTSKWATIRRAR